MLVRRQVAVALFALVLSPVHVWALPSAVPTPIVAVGDVIGSRVVSVVEPLNPRLSVDGQVGFLVQDDGEALYAKFSGTGTSVVLLEVGADIGGRFVVIGQANPFLFTEQRLYSTQQFTPSPYSDQLASMTISSTGTPASVLATGDVAPGVTPAAEMRSASVFRASGDRAMMIGRTRSDDIVHLWTSNGSSVSLRASSVLAPAAGEIESFSTLSGAIDEGNIAVQVAEWVSEEETQDVIRVYLGTTLSRAATQATAIPGFAGAQFVAMPGPATWNGPTFSDLVLVDGVLYFIGRFATNNGNDQFTAVFKWTSGSGLSIVAGAGLPTPDVAGVNFTRVYSYGVNASGDIVFVGEDDQAGVGLFLTRASSGTEKVVRVGETLYGRRLGNVEVSQIQSPSINASGQVIAPIYAGPTRRGVWMFDSELECGAYSILIEGLDIPGYTSDPVFAFSLHDTSVSSTFNGSAGLGGYNTSFNDAGTTAVWVQLVDASQAYRVLTLNVQNLACSRADVTGIGGGLPDGQITVDDLIEFTNRYGDGDLFADITAIGGGDQCPDGQLTVDDLIYFVNTFGEGCS